ncbi:protein TALPID3 isoform X2 [Sphaeramia orbicularis]|uniref:protein TALPID3 isoform X2 n=1 Tax=Sphaeramia orbicularis TaxID=375764 RepID=UPI00117ED231|nr:protein TALPID3 isoform X2 [Sphaeramia orbicularis]
MFCIRDQTVRIDPDQSTCSSDTGDVLIRSTRIQPGPVRIKVHRLDTLAQPPLPGPTTETRPESSTEHESRSTVQTSPDPAHGCSHHPSSSSSSTAAAVMETIPVTVVTPRHNQRTDQTSHVSCQSLSSANQSQAAAAARANEVLKEVEHLKAKMKMLLMPKDPLKTTRPGPAQTPPQNQKGTTTKQTRIQQNHLQSQQRQTRTQQNHLQSQQHQTRTQQNHLQSQQHQTRTQQNHLQSQQNLTLPPKEQTQIQQNPHQSKQIPTSSQQDQTQNQQNQIQFQPNKTQNSKNQIPSQQNLFQPPENKTQSQDHVFHTRQDPSHHIFQSHNSVPSHQVQSVLDQGGAVVPSLLEEASQVLHWVRRQRKLLEENLEAQLRAKTSEVLYCQLEALSANRDCTEEVHIKQTVDSWISSLTTDIRAEMASEEVAHRRPAAATTSAKPSTSRSSTHSVQGRPVSALRGAGGRQTAAHRASCHQGAGPDSKEVESYLSHLYGRAPHDRLRRTLKKSPYLRFRSPSSPQSHKPRPRLVESVRGVTVKSCKTQTSLAPPPPLSPEQPVPQRFSSAHLTSSDSFDLPLAPSDNYPVAVAIPLGRSRINSSFRCQQEVTSVPLAPPTVSMVAPDYEQEAEPVEDSEAPPLVSSPPPSNHLYVMETKGEEEENVFPGTDFVSVVDVIEQEVTQDVVQLDGGPAPPPVRYQGPLFPPQVPPPQAPPPQAPPPLSSPDQVCLLGSHLSSDTLESHLVDWVAQQLMSQMISEMYRPPPADPALNDSTDQSERDEQSVTSNIGGAAGGAGLQILMDSNVSVDSDMLRNLVQEVLTETVALMLGQRDSLQPELDPQGSGPGLGPGPAAPQEDPVLVPQALTPQATPPSSLTPLSRETPPLTTPPPSEPPSLNEEPHQPIPEPEPVATPTSSPEPPVDHQATPPPTWEDAELPLAEERPEEEEHMETHPHPVVMKVAEEEPPLSTPLPPPGSTPSPGSGSRPSSPLEDSCASSSSSSSALTSAKHISEGEVLSSVHQRMSITEEEAGLSFSGSLQELQEMDCDPPSESQVKGHEALLALMFKMGSWRRGQEGEEELSIGEVRECETASPGRTANQGELHMDLSLTLPSPHLEGDPDPGSVLDQVRVVDSDLLREGVKRTRRNGEEEEEGRVRRMMDIHVPSIRADCQDQNQNQEDENRADTESSNDVF